MKRTPVRIILLLCSFCVLDAIAASPAEVIAYSFEPHSGEVRYHTAQDLKRDITVSQIQTNIVKAVSGGPTFEVSFADIDQGTGFGFDQPGFGAVRVNTVLAVFEYVSSIFPSHEGTARVNFELSISDPGFQFAGQAFPSFPGYPCVDGYQPPLMLEAIVNDKHLGDIDGSIVLNFGPAISWNDNHTVVPGRQLLDLYSLVLHEVGHALGFLGFAYDQQGSRIFCDGQDAFPNFVEAIRDEAGQPLWQIIDGVPTFVGIPSVDFLPNTLSYLELPGVSPTASRLHKSQFQFEGETLQAFSGHWHPIVGSLMSDNQPRRGAQTFEFSENTQLFLKEIIGYATGDPAELALQSVNAADGTYEPGETIIVDYSISNSGTDASGAFTLTLYVSTDSNISNTDTLLATEQIADVAGGATLDQQATGNIPVDMPDGDYFIGAILTFADSNTADNTAFDASTVTIKTISEQSIGCDDDFVLSAEDGFEIKVSANGVDDTLNLQCAIDFAASAGMPVVRLAGASYRISQLIATDYVGALSGIAKSGTSLEILDGSIDCSTMAAAGRTPAAIKFDGGDARIERMTIVAGAPCMAGSLQTVLHFTGDSALAANCLNDVIFGNVDRVDILGPGVDGLTETAVSVFAEGSFLGGCKQTLLGTFKLNRSVVSGFPAGLVTSMRGGAQVDVNFNEFSENLIAINMTDSNQNATITNNTIDGDNTADSGYTGILAGTVSASAANTSRVVINNNTFNLNATFAQASNAVLYDQQGKIANISTVITNNRFNLDGDSTTGIVATDVNKGHIAANRFSGNGLAGVMVLADRILVSGWTVTSNKGFASFMSSSADVLFGVDTQSCILGAGQAATFTDMGTGNSTPSGGD